MSKKNVVSPLAFQCTVDLEAFGPQLKRWIESILDELNIVIVSNPPDDAWCAVDVKVESGTPMLKVTTWNSHDDVERLLRVHRIPKPVMRMPLSANFVWIDRSLLDGISVRPVWVFVDETDQILKDFKKAVQHIAEEAKKQYKK